MLKSIAARLNRTVFDIKKCNRGNIAMMFALSLPALLGALGAASDYSMLEMKRTSLQAAADASALAAAKELGIASSNDSAVIGSAQNYAKTSLGKSDSDAVTTVTVDRKKGSVTIAISEAWTPLFAQYLNAGITPISVKATAVLAGSTNICVLTLNSSDNRTLFMDKSAKLTANNCGVYSNAVHNHAIWLDQNATMNAALTCAVGGVTLKSGGAISPPAVTGCPSVADPLSTRPIPTIPASCIANPNLLVGNVTLSPGHYCSGLRVGGVAQVKLLPGVYVISGAPLSITGLASFTGTHVGFYLDGDGAFLDFGGSSLISLTGAVDTEMAGMLIFEDPSATEGRQHHIASLNVQTLTGTIYLPKGYLLVDPNALVANKSAYTAIISNRLELTAGPELVLNSNYGATDVPVPAGIRSSSTVVLTN